VAPSPSDPVAVIGASGALGFGLAVRLAAARVPIAIGSRDETRAQETAERARATIPDGQFSAHDNAGAAEAAHTVILSVPFRNQAEIVHNLAQALAPGQLLIDATVPLAAAVGGKATRTLGIWQGAAAEQAREMAPEGVRCADCGRLEMARITESLTALLIAVNARYKAHAGVRLAGLPDPVWE